MVSLDKSGQVVWQQRLTRVSAGTYAQVYSEVVAAEQARKSDGGGIGGALLGAVIGGALTGGSAEGIINGARVMSSEEGARQVYQEYEGQRIVREQEAANLAAAAASVAGYSRSDSGATGSGGQSNYGSSASTASRSGSGATQAAAPVERRPLRILLSVVPAVNDKDRSQPVCVSNVLDLGEVSNWPNANGSYDDNVAYEAARPLFASFVALCRNERGDTRTASPATVSVYSNAYSGTDLDDERNKIISSHTPNAYWLVTM